MKDLLLELIPHAPRLGLYVAPDIPPKKLRNAIDDFAPALRPEEVLALYDCTLFGSAKDGALFTEDRFVFQNNDLEPPQEVRYGDIVRVEQKRKFLSGRKVLVNVNRGRATIIMTIDFSGKPGAADYVARFLQDAMLRGAADEMDRRRPRTESDAPATDVEAVRRALDDLRTRGHLSDADYRRMLQAIRSEP